MRPELPTPQDTSNHLILAKSLLDMVLTDQKYQKFEKELQTIQSFKDGKASIDDAINALKTISKSLDNPTI